MFVVSKHGGGFLMVLFFLGDFCPELGREGGGESFHLLAGFVPAINKNF